MKNTTEDRLSACEERYQQLDEKYSTLLEMTKASTTPTWCIEFVEPVNLNTSADEIVRQVFQNECYWSMCNIAMASLYNLPDNLDFNKQPVNLYFPHSAENEAFVLELIDNDFSVDRAISLDTSHDGSLVYIENTVRAKKEGGFMQRMWGTARDITEDKRKHDRLVRSEHEMRGVLSSVPDIILVVDPTAVLLGANPSFESRLGWPVDDWLGRDISELLDIKKPLEALRNIGSSEPAHFSLTVKLADKSTLAFDILLTAVLDEIHSNRYVAVMRAL
ncbi:PAS domain-containing protein [Dasania marina]|uniref:PAS domain-containing protein n=1 Tax=Dasania marina TaxID=471499 RepID=UPI0030DD0664|tara:strand:+ start:76074 stop:76901 length:828 start_codon:yes stop_codon:yes gene_type:complete